MTYDWDGARSRRVRLVKIGAVVLAIGLLAVVADKALAYSRKTGGGSDIQRAWPLAKSKMVHG